MMDGRFFLGGISNFVQTSHFPFSFSWLVFIARAHKAQDLCTDTLDYKTMCVTIKFFLVSSASSVFSMGQFNLLLLRFLSCINGKNAVIFTYQQLPFPWATIDIRLVMYTATGP